MIVFAWILLLAASTSVELVDEVYGIPPAEWRYVEIDLKQQPALVVASYQVETGAPEVRLALMRREDLERLRDGRPHGVLEVTPPGPSGHLAHRVPRPGEYVIVLENRAGLGAPWAGPAAVHLRIRLDFAGRREPEVTLLSHPRQLTVIVLSFAVFFGIVTYSARRLLRAIRRPPVSGD